MKIYVLLIKNFFHLMPQIRNRKREKTKKISINLQDKIE